MYTVTVKGAYWFAAFLAWTALLPHRIMSISTRRAGRDETQISMHYNSLYADHRQTTSVQDGAKAVFPTVNESMVKQRSTADDHMAVRSGQQLTTTCCDKRSANGVCVRTPSQ